jgi:hypothetical protein
VGFSIDGVCLTRHVLVLLVIFCLSLRVDESEGGDESNDHGNNDDEEICAIANYLIEKHIAWYDLMPNVIVPADPQNTETAFFALDGQFFLMLFQYVDDECNVL